jgi:hypothetical protein
MIEKFDNLVTMLSASFGICSIIFKFWIVQHSQVYIPASPGYGVYISQLVCYSRDCAQHSYFLDRAQLLTQRLLQEGYVTPGSSLQNATVVITICLSITKYPYLKWQSIFYFLARCVKTHNRTKHKCKKTSTTDPTQIPCSRRVSCSCFL